MFTLETIQDEILAFLQTTVPWTVGETGVPDISQLETVNGQVKPYIVVQFGDIAPGGNRAMSGAFDDDYQMSLYITVIGPTAKMARSISNTVLQQFLGKTFDWAGQIRKRSGGGMYSSTASNSATEAYAFPSIFNINVQLAETN